MAASGECHCRMAVPDVERHYPALAVVPYAEKRCLLMQPVRRADSSWNHWDGFHDGGARQKRGHDDDHHQPLHSQTLRLLPPLK
ncbi:hypothetical protein SAMN05428971_0786 [Candidatus Pantoea varia]|uniref:Uncharacterized protein n=1 Tax=Candidatus Pantoea varia TaxID=1881036 RepID=A0A1I4XMF9_9GAMM|nr:hypothetical protein SAMN05428971_0786 [Pantoea varia]